jgi:organic hydroperoxide reductase OsmC/OhrA
MAGIWSPEHLFVANVNSCFMTTFLSVAENSKLDFKHFECDAVGTLEKIDGKYMISEITLSPILILTIENEKGLRVLEMSEKACLIANSVKTNIKLHPQIRIEG